MNRCHRTQYSTHVFTVVCLVALGSNGVCLAGWNPIKRAYEAQKNLIQQAQGGVQHAVEETAKSVKRTDEGQTAVQKAVDNAVKAGESQKNIAAPTDRIAALESALSQARSALVKARGDLAQAKEDQEYTEKELRKYQSALQSISEKSDTVDEKAGWFDWIRNGLLASLIANAATIATLWNSLRGRLKRVLELRKLEVDLAIQECRLSEMRKKQTTIGPGTSAERGETTD